MKVKDLIEKLKYFNSETEIVLKHKDGRQVVINKDIRVYAWEGRAIIDGYNQECKCK